MEPDLSEFVALTRKQQRKPCKVAAVAELLSADEAEALLAAIKATDGGAITVSAVIEWLAIRGHELQQNSIVYHRRGRCSCDG